MKLHNPKSIFMFASLFVIASCDNNSSLEESKATESGGIAMTFTKQGDTLDSKIIGRWSD
jgi:hypothetical protein